MVRVRQLHDRHAGDNTDRAILAVPSKGSAWSRIIYQTQRRGSSSALLSRATKVIYFDSLPTSYLSRILDSTV
jgi:hypothetical protein